MEYYLRITRRYLEQFGDHGYPEILIYSVSFQPYVDWPKQNRWDLIAAGLLDAAQKLELAGADCILIATNTMHIVIEEIRSKINIPVISLLDVVGDAILSQGINKVGLLGTRYTMEHGFFQAALVKKGIQCIVPDENDRNYVHDVIYNELVSGIIRPESRTGYLAVIEKLRSEGAGGIILGCTEIPLLVHQEDTTLPLFDTTTLHADAALEWAIK